nr:MAG TPA: hypothetical protein [Caudoviricetes sp.]
MRTKQNTNYHDNPISVCNVVTQKSSYPQMIVTTATI